MALNFTQTIRQTNMLNHSLVQVLRMNRTELQEHLTEAMDSNPFVQAEMPVATAAITGQSHRDHPEIAAETRQSLFQFVSEQIPFVVETPRETAIAIAFLRELEPSGWLGKDPKQIAAEIGVSCQDCLDVLTRLQGLEPVGVFARDLRECLRLQAAERGELDQVMLALIDDLEAVTTQDSDSLARRLGTTPAEIVHRLRLIRQLDPKPGCRFDNAETMVRDSDVVVTLQGQDLVIELNSASFPSLRRVEAVKMRAVAPEHREMLRRLVTDARALRNACTLRRATSLALVSAIFRRQRAFLTRGYAALVPMRMWDLANDIGVSEATVSRILNGLSLHCAQGTIPARTLFCGSVSYCAQGHTKHVAQQKIRALITSECANLPLSDGDIAEALKKSGLGISRRTVAKYRQELGLDARAERRKYAHLNALMGDVDTSDTTRIPT